MRTRPLTLAAFGVVAVALDPRVVAWDPFPDVVGWLLIAFAAWRLSVWWTFALALVAAVASVAEAQLPYHYDAIDPITGEVVVDVQPGTSYHELIAFDHVSGPRLLLLASSVALGGIGPLDPAARSRGPGGRAPRPAVGATARAPGVGGGAGMGGAAPHAGGRPGAARRGRLRPGLERALGVPGHGGDRRRWPLVALVFATRSNRLWSAAGGEVASPWAELMVPDELEDGY